MPSSRISYGLLTSQNQGDKKQGLPPTVGLRNFSMNVIKRKAWPSSAMRQIACSLYLVDAEADFKLQNVAFINEVGETEQPTLNINEILGSADKFIHIGLSPSCVRYSSEWTPDR